MEQSCKMKSSIYSIEYKREGILDLLPMIFITMQMAGWENKKRANVSYSLSECGLFPVVQTTCDYDRNSICKDLEVHFHPTTAENLLKSDR